jgi:hypothetical protein
MTEPLVSLRCDLIGPIGKKFLEVKEACGLDTNAEVLRLLVSIGHQSLVMYPVGELPVLRIAPRIGRPPAPISPEILGLAAELDTDPADLARDLPTIRRVGSRTYGTKRLEVYMNSGSLHARVWQEQRCLYSVPLKA